jgi:hypothetical protein
MRVHVVLVTRRVAIVVMKVHVPQQTQALVVHVMKVLVPIVMKVGA